MRRRKPFHRRIIALYTNSDYPSLITSAIISVGAVSAFPDYVRQKYLESFGGIPSTALALMGFVLTAAAIVVSVQDKGMIRLFKKHRNDLWVMTKKVFFLTARVLGLLSILVFVLGDSPLVSCPCAGRTSAIGEKIYLALIALMLVFSIFQINKMIYVLSRLMDAAQDTELATEIEEGLKNLRDVDG